MKILPYTDIEATRYNSDAAQGIAARVAIGKKDGAPNFCMRVFEMAPGGHSPKHTHDWEHEIFVYSGEGEFYSGGNWHQAKTGNVVFIPANEEHQIRNSGKEVFTFVCLVPGKAPEL